MVIVTKCLQPSRVWLPLCCSCSHHRTGLNVLFLKMEAGLTTPNLCRRHPRNSARYVYWTRDLIKVSQFSFVEAMLEKQCYVRGSLNKQPAANGDDDIQARVDSLQTRGTSNDIASLKKLLQTSTRSRLLAEIIDCDIFKFPSPFPSQSAQGRSINWRQTFWFSFARRFILI